MSVKHYEDYLPEQDEDDDMARAEQEIDNSKPIQWTFQGGRYYPAGQQSLTDEMKAGVYKIEQTMTGWRIAPHSITSDNLFRFPDSASDSVIEDVKTFWASKKKFEARGFVHKRGFILHGPPGSGKTATLCMITEMFVENNGLVFLIDNIALLSIALKSIRDIEPDRPIAVILEDIDTIIDGGQEECLLPLLDGENSVANVVYLATTNYLDRLADRIKNRPSRFDQIVKVGVPSVAARKMYISKRVPELVASEVDEWVKATDGLSIAHIKEVIIGRLCYNIPLGKIVKRVKNMGKGEDEE